VNEIEKFFEKENFGKLLLRIIIGGFIITKGVIYISNSAFALQVFDAMINFIFKTNIHSQAFAAIMSLLIIILGTFFVIGFHFRKSTLLLLIIFLIKMMYARFVAKRWIDPNVLYTAAYCSVMLSYLFVGPGTFSVDKHK
jgi:uncharacterized membrane protein YphA (DoxX/SURF4 family)